MSEIKCTTIEKIGIIRQGANGWNKELRLVSWNDADPKYDIRDWSPDDEKMGNADSVNASYNDFKPFHYTGR